MTENVIYPVYLNVTVDRVILFPFVMLLVSKF